MNRKPKNLKAAFDSLGDELAELHVHWNTFLELFGKSRERLDFLMRSGAGTFFAIVQNVMIDHIEITLAKFGDPRISRKGHEYLSLEQIRGIVAERGDVRLCSELKSHLTRFRDICKDITAHRHKHLAHFDYKTLVESKPEWPPKITRKTITDALNELDSFMKKAADALDKSVDHDFDPVGIVGDADDLVELLKFASRYDELRRARKIDVLDIRESRYYQV